MAEIQALLLSKVVPGSIVGVIIAIVFMMIRSRLITIFTSTKIEKLVYSKEKIFFIKATKTIFEVVLIFLALCSLSVLLIISNDKNFLVVLTICISIFLITFGLFYAFIFLKKGLANYFKEKDRKIGRLIFLIYIICIYAYIPLMLGSAVFITDNDIEQISNPNKVIELRIGFVVVVIFFVFMASIVRFVFRETVNILERRNSVEKPLFIKIENNSEIVKFYIFHLNESNQFLLGDNPVQDKCTVYKFIEKEELIKKEIYVHQDEDPSPPVA